MVGTLSPIARLPSPQAPRQKLVSKPRLFARLDEAVAHSLTVISAPADSEDRLGCLNIVAKTLIAFTMS
jgi:hypothetical protein